MRTLYFLPESIGRAPEPLEAKAEPDSRQAEDALIALLDDGRPV
jgi:hypothetical protein